jgi:hypothetical protein
MFLFPKPCGKSTVVAQAFVGLLRRDDVQQCSSWPVAVAVGEIRIGMSPMRLQSRRCSWRFPDTTDVVETTSETSVTVSMLIH